MTWIIQLKNEVEKLSGAMYIWTAFFTKVATNLHENHGLGTATMANVFQFLIKKNLSNEAHVLRWTEKTSPEDDPHVSVVKVDNLISSFVEYIMVAVVSRQQQNTATETKFDGIVFEMLQQLEKLAIENALKLEKLAIESKDNAVKLEHLANENAEMKTILARLPLPENEESDSNIISVATLGNNALEEVQLRNQKHQFVPQPEKPAILNRKEQHSLSSFKKERDVVKFLTPHLERVLCADDKTDWVVVNSEEYGWIRTKSKNRKADLKPDMFFCHKSLYEKKTKNDGNKLKFGVLHWRLRDSLGILFEAKMNIGESGHAAFGEVLRYMQLIRHCNSPAHGKAILFDMTHFWLIDFYAGRPSEIVTVNWIDGGSTEALSCFAQTSLPWIDLLEQACRHFNLVVEEHGFLGCGVSGRVFRVRRKNSETSLALKLVLGNGCTSLEVEFACLKKAYRLCNKHVIEAEGYAYFDDKNVDAGFLGGALLLLQVGKPINDKNETCKSRISRLLHSLFNLHKAGVAHGDARLANVVEFKEEFLWIDFRASITGTIELSKKADMKSLTKSILHTEKLPETLSKLVRCYTGKDDSEITAITGAVTKALDGEDTTNRNRENQVSRITESEK